VIWLVPSFNTVISTLMGYTNSLFHARDVGPAGTLSGRSHRRAAADCWHQSHPHIAEEPWMRQGIQYPPAVLAGRRR